MDIRAMIESVVQEVVQSMKHEKENENFGKVLFVFCDSSAHEPFADQFIKLKNSKIGYDILFLDGETSSWLGMQRVESTGSERVIATDEYSPAAIELAKDYDGIIIPEIDLDNAARVAAGLKGTIKAEIIFSAIMLQKFVLVGGDSPGIKRSDRRCLNTLSLPAPYQKRFYSYIEQMTELGIEFFPQMDLSEAVIQKFTKKMEDVQSTCESDLRENDHALENKAIFKKKLLTHDWIESQAHFPNNSIYLSKGVIISPLAKDLLKEKKLTVRFIEKG
ncbi:hypothetical protein BIV60_06795 [Bacillus sp. MUM 116]|uniref:hypothetical protein n=1 Tax=Bacillus sp. MUM 116 TaxID=1678002 RepID=UPI0008F58D92|nr:hypothetical protein [Bacillus sp. MUM 116]OIK15990.1 hypothetical protein BIV60_06795 [Bacillus sp. MUM 116]